MPLCRDAPRARPATWAWVKRIPTAPVTGTSAFDAVSSATVAIPLPASTSMAVVVDIGLGTGPAAGAGAAAALLNPVARPLTVASTAIATRKVLFRP